MADNNISKHCNEILPGLDEDISEYICGILEDDMALEPDSIHDTTEMLAGLLAEYCNGDEEDASAKAALLIGRLTLQGNTNNNDKNNDDTRVALSLAAQLAINDDHSSAALDEIYGNNGKRSTVNTILGEEDDTKNNTNTNTNANANTNTNTTTAKSKKTTKSKKQSSSAGGKVKNRKPTAAEIATAQIEEIETELHDARVASVRARAKLGAYRGSLDAKNFTLPNPGGGAPLLEDAACRLVWGKRYGELHQHHIICYLVLSLLSYIHCEI